MNNKILIIGSYFQDICYLIIIAEALSNLGYSIHFIVSNPIERLRTQAIKSIAEKGFSFEEIPDNILGQQSLWEKLIVRNNSEYDFAINTLKRINPSLIITTKNLFRGKFYDAANDLLIPSFYYQWTLMHSKINMQRIERAENEYANLKLSVKSKIAKKTRAWIKRNILGERERWPLAAPYSYLLVMSDLFRKYCIDAGINENKIIVTGNIQCDEMFNNRHLNEVEIEQFKVSIGLNAKDKYIIHTREDYERLKRLSPEDRINAENAILNAIKLAAPEFRRVVKIHPKEGESQIKIIKSIDPDAIIIGNEIDTPKAIACSSLLISSMSTTLAWAVGLDVPAISSFLWNFLKEYRDTRFYVGIDYADNFDDLVNSIRHNLFDHDYIGKMKVIRMEGCEKMLKADGLGLSRIVNYIESKVKI